MNLHPRRNRTVGVTYQGLSVSRQQKWHRMRDLVRREAQVFSCMQENT
jgi:hypothetical protein